MHIENWPIKGQGTSGTGDAQIRALPGIDEVTIDIRGLPAGKRFTVYLTRGSETTALMSATSSNMGDIPEETAFLDIFANHYDKVLVVRPGNPGPLRGAAISNAAGYVNGNATNLATSITSETGAIQMYATFASQATTAGDTSAASMFTEVQGDETGHHNTFATELHQLTGKLAR